MHTHKPQALTTEQRQHAETRYRETMTAENRILRDDTLTPFFIGMNLSGFSAVTSSGGC